jgi:hypothetical protein
VNSNGLRRYTAGLIVVSRSYLAMMIFGILDCGDYLDPESLKIFNVGGYGGWCQSPSGAMPGS